MTYSIQEVANLTGITPRTLRYYHGIGLLIPKAIGANNYRIYDTENLDTLQHILFLKELGFPLKEIQSIIHDTTLSKEELYLTHYQLLLKKQEQLNGIVNLMEHTLKELKGETFMTPEEKFHAFKKDKLAENQRMYGEELIGRYDEVTLNKSEQAYLSLTQKEMNELENLEATMIQSLLLRPDIPSDTASLIYTCHKQWLTAHWGHYDKAMHNGLSHMYLSDQRFADYYDSKAKEPITPLLVQIIQHYTC